MADSQGMNQGMNQDDQCGRRTGEGGKEESSFCHGAIASQLLTSFLEVRSALLKNYLFRDVLTLTWPDLRSGSKGQKVTSSKSKLMWTHGQQISFSEGGLGYGLVGSVLAVERMKWLESQGLDRQSGVSSTAGWYWCRVKSHVLSGSTNEECRILLRLHDPPSVP